jgi:hypothetical protein
LEQGIHTMIIEPPNSGKQSLINQGFISIHKGKTISKICTVPLFNVRQWSDFLFCLAEQSIGCFVNTLQEWKSICTDLLPLNNPTVFVNDKIINDVHLSFNPNLSDLQRDELLELPESLCTHFQERLIVYMNDFQNIELFEPSYKPLINVLNFWKRHAQTTYLISASKPSSKRFMDGNKELLQKVFEQIPFTAIDEKLFTDFIIKGFTKAGRSINKDLAEMIYRKMDGHPYYTQHFAHLCYLNTKGFMNSAMFQQAYCELLDIHHRRFTQITDDLSLPQINYLKATIHNVEHFCTVEVLKEYGLNSSANVSRIRAALEKKGVMLFEHNKLHFADPVFKIWFKERFIPYL